METDSIEGNDMVEQGEIIRLLSEPVEKRDISWLRRAVQMAIQVELSTLPPYLCALWSIMDDKHPVYRAIREIVIDEMLHMGLMCNLLTAIGGRPKLFSPDVAPRYPGVLPGGVMPWLPVYLARLSKESIAGQFMQIEHPDFEPIVGPPTFAALAEGELAIAARMQVYSSIGVFYRAIRAALPDSFSKGNQFQYTFGEDRDVERERLFVILTCKEAERAIDLISGQGEGTFESAKPDKRGRYPHYYAFGEIFWGRKVRQGADGKLSFTGDEVPFPAVYPVAIVPCGGYSLPESKTFDTAYSCMMLHLQRAWEGGKRAEMKKAVDEMRKLEGLAVALMKKPIPGGCGNCGPAFSLLTDVKC